MANPYKRLYSPDAAPAVRESLAAADAGGWVPEDEVDPTLVILDAREWQTLRVFPEFKGGVGTSATLTPLLWVYSDTVGHTWIALASTGALAPEQFSEVAVEGHMIAFRVTGLVLGTATSADIRVTGGRLRENLAGG